MTDLYRAFFPKAHTFIAVVHVRDAVQAEQNVRVACQYGADGVFLINHGELTYRGLLSIYDQVRRQHPRYWIGLNFLDRQAPDAAQLLPLDAQALWVDDDVSRYRNMETVWQNRSGSQLLFSGVAFKGQPAVRDIEAATRSTPAFVDVLTTSGPGTGFAPAIEKLMAVRRGAGLRITANASGTTIANVRQFMPFVNCFIVATGVSTNFHTLNGMMVREFADTIA